MPKEAIAQIRMDAEMKETVERIYRNLGTTFAEAVRIFAAQSIKEKGFPFVPKDYAVNNTSARGLLKEYASADRRKLEKEAFIKAMAAKHE
ncbi:MAG: type II toxin-antitoxin system RelB/DinJ family antitoxin [Solobacterium sp.]|nr:type II toxin-antitoxin system RelB/DinJ family antitoxin [Solobacterium sp.]